MKRIISTALALVLAFSLCAYGGQTPAAAAEDISYEKASEEANDVIKQGVFYFDQGGMSPDDLAYIDGISPEEGAIVVSDLLMQMGFYDDNGKTNPPYVYISFRGVTDSNSATGGERYTYNVALGSDGMMAGDYEVIHQVSVDYSEKAAAVYEAAAPISLTPRVGNVGKESYVYFGKYKHLLETWDSGKRDPEATPVLWRVMEAGATQATLLSHYLVDVMGYHDSNNEWETSEAQTWLNSATGFLADFDADTEQAAMASIPATTTDDVVGAKVTLPSGWADTSSDSMESQSYSGDIKTWFGENDYQIGAANVQIGPNTNARKAKFKDAGFKYDDANYGWYYWTRSPPAGDSYYGLHVNTGGALTTTLVGSGGVGVRPAIFLNLQSFIFKSASAFSSAGEAGSFSNPYFLYLSTTTAKQWNPAASINGNKMTLSFTTPPMPDYPNVFHAYADTPGDLKTSFTLSDGTTVTGVEFNGTSIELTLSKTYAPDETVPAVSYSGNTATDGIGFVDTGIVPTTLAAFDPDNGKDIIETEP